MAGIGNIGTFGMTASQFKSAMINTSGFAAQGTGTAKQFNNKMEEQLQPKQDGVSLSENALTLSKDAEELQENQRADQQKELQKNNEEEHKVGEDMSHEAQMFGEDDGFEQKLKAMRMKHNAGHAAMASGSKPKESEKTENQNMSHISSKNLFKAPGKSASPDETNGSSSYDYKELMEDLNQASQLGLLESEAKKLKSKADEKEALRKLAMASNQQLYKTNNSSDLSDDQTVNKAREARKEAQLEIDKIKSEMIEKIMNRTPEEILSDVPVQFQATAKIMLTGQINEVGEPKPALTEMKTEPKVESQMMELIPAPTAGEIEVAEKNEPAMSLEFPTEVPA